jgi:hypothetical protein
VGSYIRRFNTSSAARPAHQHCTGTRTGTGTGTSTGTWHPTLALAPRTIIIINTAPNKRLITTAVTAQHASASQSPHSREAYQA